MRKQVENVKIMLAFAIGCICFYIMQLISIQQQRSLEKINKESNIDNDSSHSFNKDMCDCTSINPIKVENENLNHILYDNSNQNNLIVHKHIKDDIEDFRAAASSLIPTTDKVTTHSYHIMYGIFLNLMKHHKIKFLEIGLGCDMFYGPGASSRLWNAYLHKDSEIWMADIDKTCVQKYSEQLKESNIKTLIGSQDSIETLKLWIQQSGGNFDIIVDDGGHKNTHIKTSFDYLWPTLKNGGFYFIEDMHVAYNVDAWQDRLENGLTMPDHIFQWTKSLLVGGEKPHDLQFIFCQHEACVLKKAD